jgi:glycerol-1-phosphate dehydrogenase [NAD(P)+]
VAVGALFASFLRRDGLVEVLDAAFAHHGVPRLPSDLGLSEDQFAAAVAEAPSTRPDRYTILEHLALDESEIRQRVEEFVGTFDR